jgi:beta-lactamase regulating signal transducer with metallopeptidase domain
MPLADVALRTAVLLLVAYASTCALRRAAAATRHLVWTLAVVGALAIPLASVVLPAWRVVPDFRAEAVGLPVVRDGHVEAPPVAAARADAPQRMMSSAPSRQSARPMWIALAWAVVTLVLLARVFGGILAVRRVSRHARPADARWRLLLDECSDAADVTRRVRLLVSRDIAVPMTWGGRRPLLLLPAEAIGWADDRARVVLLHELAHVRRADWLTNALGRVLAALHWYNPLAWIALRGMTRERERACDDFVLAQGARPSEYAQHLLEIAKEGIAGGSCAMAPAMARASELEGRLLSILTPRRREPRRLVMQALTAGAVCITIAVASAAPRERQPEPASAPAVESRLPAVSNWIMGHDDTFEEKRRASRARAALRPLAETALTHASQDAREKATLALALRPEPTVVDALLRALRDPSGQVREKAALGLALRRDRRVVDALLEAADDPDAQVREKVAIALGLSGDARAVDALNKRLDDPDPQVREKAASGLTLFSVASLVGRSNRP